MCQASGWLAIKTIQERKEALQVGVSQGFGVADSARADSFISVLFRNQTPMTNEDAWCLTSQCGLYDPL